MYYEKVEAVIRTVRMFMAPEQQLRLALKLQQWGKKLEAEVLKNGRVSPGEAAIIRTEEVEL